MSSECIFVLRTQACLSVWLLPVELTILFGSSCARILRRTRWQPAASWMHHLEAGRPGRGSLCLGGHASVVLARCRAVDFANNPYNFPWTNQQSLLSSPPRCLPVTRLLRRSRALAHACTAQATTPGLRCTAPSRLLPVCSPCSYPAPSSWSTPLHHSLPRHKCRLFLPRFGGSAYSGGSAAADRRSRPCPHFEAAALDMEGMGTREAMNWCCSARCGELDEASTFVLHVGWRCGSGWWWGGSATGRSCSSSFPIFYDSVTTIAARRATGSHAVLRSTREWPGATSTDGGRRASAASPATWTLYLGTYSTCSSISSPWLLSWNLLYHNSRQVAI
jgi:hypothetical protein